MSDIDGFDSFVRKTTVSLEFCADCRYYCILLQLDVLPRNDIARGIVGDDTDNDTDFENGSAVRVAATIIVIIPHIFVAHRYCVAYIITWLAHTRIINVCIIIEATFIGRARIVIIILISVGTDIVIVTITSTIASTVQGQESMCPSCAPHDSSSP
jgi:hypothetical protein